MNRTLLTLCLGAALTLPTKADTLATLTFGATNNLASSTAYQKTVWGVAADGRQWQMVNFSNGGNEWDYVRCGKKTLQRNAYICTSEPWSESVSEVKINLQRVFTGDKDKCNKATLALYDTYPIDNAEYGPAAGATPVATYNIDITALDTANDPLELSVNVAEPQPDMYYLISFENRGASNDGWLQVNSVVYDGTVGTDDPGTSVIYASDMTTWDKVNAGSGSNWEIWSEGVDDQLFQPMSEEIKEITGCTDGILCKYDELEDNNAWAISPSIQLKKGKSYTISVWVCDEGDYWSRESWSLSAAPAPASGNGLPELQAGIILMDHENFNNQAMIRYTAEYTPATEGNYIFGLRAYSEADQYGLYATGFSIECEQETVGIEGYESAENATPIFFDLTGRPCAPETKGVLVEVCGSKVKKVIRR